MDDHVLPFHFLKIASHGFREQLALEERSGLSVGHADWSEVRFNGKHADEASKVVTL